MRGVRAQLLMALLPGILAAQVPTRIVAPAAPGGGWDQLARTMQRVLETERIATRVTVENAPGAAGTVGLARFISADRGSGDAVLVTGLVMVGGIVQNHSPVGLGDAVPIARLVGEYEVIAVPAASPHRTLGSLLEAFRADPGSVSWGGGSAGGTDQILVDLVARAVGVDPNRSNYVAFSGGGETKTALLGGQVTVAIGGLGEFADLIELGQVRALAVSAPERIPGTAIPTLRESGFEIELANWRGVVAPPGIRPAERAALIGAMERMTRSAAWAEELERRGWEPLFLGGDGFARFLAAETERVEGLARLKAGGRGPAADLPWLPGAAGGLLILSLGYVLIRERRSIEPVSGAGLGKAGLILAAMAADVLLLDRVGFIGSSLILFAAAAVAFGERLGRAVAIGLAYCLGVFLLFSWALDIRLPTGLWWGRP
ncbi:MAG: tripartite tricarboxylate transporter substrate-binding protein [Gemmatimonadales bacterium]